MNDDIRSQSETLQKQPAPHEIIANANDLFRKTFHPMMGEVVMTQSLALLSELQQRQLMLLVQGFDTFTQANDPHKQHDIGEKLAPPDIDFLSLNTLDWQPSC